MNKLPIPAPSAPSAKNGKKRLNSRREAGAALCAAWSWTAQAPPQPLLSRLGKVFLSLDSECASSAILSRAPPRRSPSGLSAIAAWRARIGWRVWLAGGGGGGSARGVRLGGGGGGTASGVYVSGEVGSGTASGVCVSREGSGTASGVCISWGGRTLRASRQGESSSTTPTHLKTPPS